MDDLFDVFDQQPAQAKSKAESAAPQKKEKATSKDKSKKRKADGAAKEDLKESDGDAAEGTDAASNDDEAMPDAPADQADGQSKRRKKEASAEPVLTDSFQTAESREVAAASGFAPAKETESLVLSHNIQHQVALPPDLDYEYVPLSEHKPPAEPARTYPFTLDPFQSLSIA